MNLILPPSSSSKSTISNTTITTATTPITTTTATPTTYPTSTKSRTNLNHTDFANYRFKPRPSPPTTTVISTAGTVLPLTFNFKARPVGNRLLAPSREYETYGRGRALAAY